MSARAKRPARLAVSVGVLAFGWVVSAMRAESPTDSVEQKTEATSTQANEGPQLDEKAPSPIEASDRPKPPAPLSPALVKLRDRVRRVLTQYYPQHLNTGEHSCWEVMHGIIAYGVDAKLFRGSPNGPTVNAIGWMCYNGTCHDEQLFYLDRNKLVARRGPGLQGHFGQFMAIVAQSHVPDDFPMKVSGKSLTLKDLIEHEKQDCRDGEELTFKLIGLAHYLDSDTTWSTPDGQKWDIPRLIREELKQPIRGAACGGTHRLMGHSYALYKRRKQGKPIEGQFARAEKFINDYHRYAWSLQNSDGSFSTNWFKGREAEDDIDRRVKTTGHVLEWMVFSLPEDQLRDPHCVKAVNYLTNVLLGNFGHKWEVGPKGHALHALRIYDRRLFKPYDAPSAPTPPANDPPTAAQSKTVEKQIVETARKPKVEPVKTERELQSTVDEKAPATLEGPSIGTQ
jgi:hypothetical protein